MANAFGLMHITCLRVSKALPYQLLEPDRRTIWFLEPELILNIALVILGRKSLSPSCSVFFTDWPGLPDICALCQLLHSGGMSEQRNALLLDRSLWLIIFVLCTLMSLLQLLSLQYLPASNSSDTCCR